MSVVLTKKPDWKQVLNSKARLVHQQIASLQRWVEQAGGGEKMLDELSAPYYELLQSIYFEDIPRLSRHNQPAVIGNPPQAAQRTFVSRLSPSARVNLIKEIELIAESIDIKKSRDKFRTHLKMAVKEVFGKNYKLLKKKPDKSRVVGKSLSRSRFTKVKN